MSNGINVVCKKTEGKLVGPCGELVPVGQGEECGIDLVGIPRNAETEELFEVAARFGSPAILSEIEVLFKVTVDEMVRRGSSQTEIESLLMSQGVKCGIARLPRSPATFLQRRADRFLENARSLVERFKKGALNETAPTGGGSTVILGETVPVKVEVVSPRVYGEIHGCH